MLDNFILLLITKGTKVHHAIQLTVLVDNTTNKQNLKAEAGLSLYPTISKSVLPT